MTTTNPASEAVFSLPVPSAQSQSVGNATQEEATPPLEGNATFGEGPDNIDPAEPVFRSFTEMEENGLLTETASPQSGSGTPPLPGASARTVFSTPTLLSSWVPKVFGSSSSPSTAGSREASQTTTPRSRSFGSDEQRAARSKFASENLKASAGAKEAIAWGAKQLGVTEEELAVLFIQEAGNLSDNAPKVWGGAEGKYFGLIQFGPNERREVGLDPNVHNTWATQMPKVVEWLEKRGFRAEKYDTAEERIQGMYSTILGGNPNANTKKKDAFGTSIESAMREMAPGGSKYKRAESFLS